MVLCRDSFEASPFAVAAASVPAAAAAKPDCPMDSFINKLGVASSQGACDLPPAKRVYFARDSPERSLSAPRAAAPPPRGSAVPPPFSVTASTCLRVLLEQDCSTAQSLAVLLSQDYSKFSICNGDPALLLATCQLSFAQADKAFSLRTALKESGNWKLWKKYCMHMGTTPWRTAASASKMESPVEYLREVVLLTYALGYAMQHKKPRSKSNKMIKPSTAMAFLHSVSRVHRRNHLWLSRVKIPLRVTLYCFELGPRLHPEGDNKLATGNLKLETRFLT